MIREITSAANPFVKHLRALGTSKKTRQESGEFIIEGWRGIDTLLKHEPRQYQLETLVVSEEWKSDPRLPNAIDTVALPAPLFEKVSDVRNAQGILGIVRRFPAPFKFDPDAGHYLLLDNIRDPGNLGTLIRSAVGAGFAGILLYGDCVEPFNPKTVRSTMGTLAFTQLWNVSDAGLDRMAETGYALCATTGLGGQNLYETAFPEKTVLVVGSEAHGVSDKLMQRATLKITIPLETECESLNAAVAGSICMFQIKCGAHRTA
ncbi:TrmH family RNA methyltransferase [Pontiella sulfatireligans]|uniref:23S rRNA (Uridine(2479)-2'-O)-methyltransferase n=1 Tax=Pontiella sulfatireligans TaxID=2750658 RepID=A0A6C2UJU6_9BACT|nr:RNA methyltransferase [Pontiella sulfatireligans]VGO20153.1 23S rRNA (uridine(2479)-2'-O)-methyltransferase [Pontiella sulfatireligans]